MSNYLNPENLKCNISPDLNLSNLDECQESADEFYDIMENSSILFENIFKDKMVEAFKRDCPDIAKEFNNDDEIWNYLISNAKMSIKNEEEDNNEPI